MVQEDRFRADLYYRLNVFPIELPPLRDIPVLSGHFVHKFAAVHGKTIEHISDELMGELLNYDWPGNIRELQNLIERSAIPSPGRALRPLARELYRSRPRTAPGVGLVDAERAHNLAVLEGTRRLVGSRNGAAARLGRPGPPSLPRCKSWESPACREFPAQRKRPPEKHARSPQMAWRAWNSSMRKSISASTRWPGVVATPMHQDDPLELMKSQSPMGTIPSIDDIVDAVVYLTEARQVTGEVLRVEPACTTIDGK